MILVDFILDLKFNECSESVKSYNFVLDTKMDYMCHKIRQIREQYESKFELVFTIEILVGNKPYLLGFDNGLFYFYLFDREDKKVKFFDRNDIEDTTFACLSDSIFRKEVSL